MAITGQVSRPPLGRFQWPLTLQRIIDRGIADGTLHPDVTPQDIVVFGAMPAQPRPPTSAGTPPVGAVWRGLRR